MIKQIRIALYIAFFFVALTLWNQWQTEHSSHTNKQAQNSTASQQSSSSSQSSSSLPANQPQVGPSGKPPQHQQKHPATTHKRAQQTSASNQSLVSVKTDVLHMKVNPKVGKIVQAYLPKYGRYDAPSKPYRLLNTQPDTLYVAQSSLTNVPGLNNRPVPFKAAQQHYTLKKGQNKLVIPFTWTSGNGLKITKQYVFKRGSYDVHVRYHIKNQSDQTWQGRLYMQTQQKQSSKGKKDHLIGFHSFYGVALSTPQEPFTKYSFSDLKSTPLNQSIKSGWMAFVQHYFLTAWVPNDQQTFHYYSQAKPSQKLYTAGLISPTIKLKPGESVTKSSQFYVGPKIAENLKAVAPHLSLTIDYGWLWFISIAIFWLMKHIHAFVGNWGWSIVLVTLIIKLIFYKLSEKSYRSMAKMRALQPKIEKLKEQYGDDKQKLSQATMELYRKEKANPLGGCLPILVQIPVFIALYWVLAESVQLRQAPFILWIHDLSSPDPYYILPILMGLSMFIQQKLNPKPADNTQAKMMMVLPLVFTFLFLHFPAGLVLYWVVNNSLSILQQWFIMRRFEKGAYKTSKK